MREMGVCMRATAEPERTCLVFLPCCAILDRNRDGRSSSSPSSSSSSSGDTWTPGGTPQDMPSRAASLRVRAMSLIHARQDSRSSHWARPNSRSPTTHSACAAKSEHTSARGTWRNILAITPHAPVRAHIGVRVRVEDGAPVPRLAGLRHVFHVEIDEPGGRTEVHRRSVVCVVVALAVQLEEILQGAHEAETGEVLVCWARH